MPITASVVEEKAGASFSLLCDLVSSETNSNYYDFQVSWIKQSNDLRSVAMLFFIVVEFLRNV